MPILQSSLELAVRTNTLLLDVVDRLFLIVVRHPSKSCRMGGDSTKVWQDAEKGYAKVVLGGGAGDDVRTGSGEARRINTLGKIRFMLMGSRALHSLKI
jgi:hypothetical protein